MMDWLQNVDTTHLPLVAVGCSLLCVAVVIIGFLLQAVSGIFEVMTGLIEVVVEIMQGGPVAWCGCALLILGLIACAGFTYLYLQAPETCVAHPTYFCQWFGFLP